MRHCKRGAVVAEVVAAGAGTPCRDRAERKNLRAEER